MGSILEQFTTNVDDLVKKGTPTATLTTLVAVELEGLLRQRNWLHSKFMLIPPGEQVSIKTIYMPEDESWSMEAFTWRIRGMTTIHDHGVWAVVGQYRGEEVDIRYRILQGNVQEDRADIEESGRTLMSPGDVIALLPPDDIHQVRNVFHGTSMSIHVYGGNMKKIDRYVFNLETSKVTVDRRR